jgi:hypothetical protein
MTDFEAKLPPPLGQQFKASVQEKLSELESILQERARVENDLLARRSDSQQQLSAYEDELSKLDGTHNTNSARNGRHPMSAILISLGEHLRTSLQAGSLFAIAAAFPLPQKTRNVWHCFTARLHFSKDSSGNQKQISKQNRALFNPRKLRLPNKERYLRRS